MEKGLIKLQDQEWYQALCEDCQAILTEAIFTSRWALVEGYWQFGKRIQEENHNFERAKIYGKEIVQYIAKSLGKSERAVYYALQIAKKFPALDNIPEGKNITLHKLITKYLPDPKEKSLKIEKYVNNFVKVKDKSMCEKCNNWIQG